MNKDFWLIFLTAYSVNLTLQFALNIYKLIKLKEENKNLKNGRTFNFEIKINDTENIDEVKKSIEKILSNDNTTI